LLKEKKRRNGKRQREMAISKMLHAQLSLKHTSQKQRAWDAGSHTLLPSPCTITTSSGQLISKNI